MPPWTVLPWPVLTYVVLWPLYWVILPYTRRCRETKLGLRWRARCCWRPAVPSVWIRSTRDTGCRWSARLCLSMSGIVSMWWPIEGVVVSRWMPRSSKSVAGRAERAAVGSTPIHSRQLVINRCLARRLLSPKSWGPWRLRLIWMAVLPCFQRSAPFRLMNRPQDFAPLARPHRK